MNEKLVSNLKSTLNLLLTSTDKKFEKIVKDIINIMVYKNSILILILMINHFIVSLIDVEGEGKEQEKINTYLVNLDYILNDFFGCENILLKDKENYEEIYITYKDTDEFNDLKKSVIDYLGDPNIDNFIEIYTTFLKIFLGYEKDEIDELKKFPDTENWFDDDLLPDIDVPIFKVKNVQDNLSFYSYLDIQKCEEKDTKSTHVRPNFCIYQNKCFNFTTFKKLMNSPELVSYKESLLKSIVQIFFSVKLENVNNAIKAKNFFSPLKFFSNHLFCYGNEFSYSTACVKRNSNPTLNTFFSYAKMITDRSYKPSNPDELNYQNINYVLNKYNVEGPWPIVSSEYDDKLKNIFQSAVSIYNYSDNLETISLKKKIFYKLTKDYVGLQIKEGKFFSIRDKDTIFNASDELDEIFLEICKNENEPSKNGINIIEDLEYLSWHREYNNICYNIILLNNILEEYLEKTPKLSELSELFKKQEPNEQEKIKIDKLNYLFHYLMPEYDVLKTIGDHKDYYKYDDNKNKEIGKRLFNYIIFKNIYNLWSDLERLEIKKIKKKSSDILKRDCTFHMRPVIKCIFESDYKSKTQKKHPRHGFFDKKVQFVARQNTTKPPKTKTKTDCLKEKCPDGPIFFPDNPSMDFLKKIFGKNNDNKYIHLELNIIDLSEYEMAQIMGFILFDAEHDFYGSRAGPASVFWFKNKMKEKFNKNNKWELDISQVNFSTFFNEKDNKDNLIINILKFINSSITPKTIKNSQIQFIGMPKSSDKHDDLLLTTFFRHIYTYDILGITAITKEVKIQKELWKIFLKEKDEYNVNEDFGKVIDNASPDFLKKILNDSIILFLQNKESNINLWNNMDEINELEIKKYHMGPGYCAFSSIMDAQPGCTGCKFYLKDKTETELKEFTLVDINLSDSDEQYIYKCEIKCKFIKCDLPDSSTDEGVDSGGQGEENNHYYKLNITSIHLRFKFKNMDLDCEGSWPNIIGSSSKFFKNFLDEIANKQLIDISKYNFGLGKVARIVYDNRTTKSLTFEDIILCYHMKTLGDSLQEYEAMLKGKFFFGNDRPSGTRFIIIRHILKKYYEEKKKKEGYLVEKNQKILNNINKSGGGVLLKDRAYLVNVIK